MVSQARHEETPKPSVFVYVYLTASLVAMTAWLIGWGSGVTSTWTIFFVAPHPILALTAVAAASRTRYIVKRDGLEFSYVLRGRVETRSIAFSKVEVLAPRRGSGIRVMQDYDLAEFPESIPRQEFVSRWVLVYESKEGRKAILFNPSETFLRLVRERGGDKVVAG